MTSSSLPVYSRYASENFGIDNPTINYRAEETIDTSLGI
jgi:hypothetical protein